MAELIDIQGDGLGNQLYYPNDIAVDSLGDVYVTSVYDFVFKITPERDMSIVLDASGDGLGNVLEYPCGVTTDSAGNIYVAGRYSDNVFSIAPDGAVDLIMDASGDGAGNSLDLPSTLEFDAAGNLYVAGQSSSNVFRVDPGGTVTQIIDATGDGAGNTLIGARGLALGPSGNVYVAGFRNLFKITPAGDISEIFDIADDGSGIFLDFVRGVAADSQDNVYVSDSSNYIYRIALDGSIAEVMDSTGDGGTFFGNPLLGAGDLVVDAADNLYVIGTTSNNVFRRTPEGFISQIAEETGDRLGNPLSQPNNLAVGADGNVYVSAWLSRNAFRIEGSLAAPTTIEWSLVDTPGNACDPQAEGCFGDVEQRYWISRFEISNAQYADFLNTVVTGDDIRGLYDENMGTSIYSGIVERGLSGAHWYCPIDTRADNPVNYVSFWDAARRPEFPFANDRTHLLDRGLPSGSPRNGTRNQRPGAI